jgi:hypothetical protein
MTEHASASDNNRSFWCILWALLKGEELNEGEVASTPVRFLRSPHVADLRWIVYLVLGLGVAYCVLVLFAAPETEHPGRINHFLTYVSPDHALSGAFSHAC